MKKTLLLSCLLTVLVGTSSTAMADQVTDSGVITVNVQSGCDLFPVADVNLGDIGQISETMMSTGIGVICNDQLPYTLELSSEVGGYFPITDSNTGRTYKVQLLKPNQTEAWGTIANGDELASIGTGQVQFHWAQVKWSNAYNDNGNGTAGVWYRPEKGDYYGQVTVTLNYI